MDVCYILSETENRSSKLFSTPVNTLSLTFTLQPHRSRLQFKFRNSLFGNKIPSPLLCNFPKFEAEKRLGLSMVPLSVERGRAMAIFFGINFVQREATSGRRIPTSLQDNGLGERRAQGVKHVT